MSLLLKQNGGRISAVVTEAERPITSDNNNNNNNNNDNDNNNSLFQYFRFNPNLYADGKVSMEPKPHLS